MAAVVRLLFRPQSQPTAAAQLLVLGGRDGKVAATLGQPVQRGLWLQSR